MVKLSGIGCSSKTTAYFVSGGHGFNSVHGRMPSIAMGANAANRDLTYIGVSGDGDTLSIGLGQFCHAIRRNLNMLYIIENNGVYGLTKGQFSASADIGTKAKKGETNFQPPIDPVLLAMTLGASFVARSFSGDKQQLVPLIQAGLKHQGFALIDVLSPCVTFNDHEGSTKSYAYTREHYEPAVHADFVPLEREITRRLCRQAKRCRVVMHDGSRIVLRKLDAAYDPTNRSTAAGAYPGAHEGRGVPDRAAVRGALAERVPRGERAHPMQPLNSLPYEALSPGSQGLREDPGALPLRSAAGPTPPRCPRPAAAARKWPVSAWVRVPPGGSGPGGRNAPPPHYVRRPPLRRKC